MPLPRVALRAGPGLGPVSFPQGLAPGLERSPQTRLTTVKGKGAEAAREGNMCLCVSVCASFSPGRLRKQNLFLDAGRDGGESGSGVCTEREGRLLSLKLFRDGQKPGQWT